MGAMKFLDSLSLGSYQREQAEKKKLAEADKVANAFYKLSTPADAPDGSKKAHPLGSPEDWKLMSAMERVATAKAFQEKSVLDEVAQRLNLALQQGQRDQERFDEETATRKAGEEAIAAAAPQVDMLAPLRQGLGALGIQLPGDMQMNQRGPITADSLQRAMRAQPKSFRDEAATRLLEALQRNGENGRTNSVNEGSTKSGTPYVTFGNTFQFDPAATGEMRQTNAIDLLNKREELRNQRAAQLTARDLLQSYEQDMEMLSKDFTLPPEERAAMRLSIRQKIDQLRATGGTSSTSPKPPGTNAPARYKLINGQLQLVQ